MHNLNATLLAAMDTGNYDPYFLITIQDNYDGKVLFSAQPTGYELSDLEFECTVLMSHFMDLPFYRTSIILTRGVTIASSQYTLSTSKFCIISSTWDGNFQTFKCHLIPRVYYNAAGDLTYNQVITAFCAKFNKTAVFLDGAAAWLAWQFLPTGRSLTLNNAQTFFQQLKQKYFIFACDNGSDQILFYAAFNHVAAPQYQVTGYRFDVDYNVDQRRQYIWRDENETMHKTVPSFAQASSLSGVNAFQVMSLCDLGAGVVLAGNSKNVNGAGRIYRSTDYGLTWDSGYATGYASIFSMLNLGNGIVLAAGYYGGPIFRSADYGVTWTLIREIGVDSTLGLCDCGNGVVLCGHSGSSSCDIWRSVDYGLTWAQAQVLGTETQVYAVLYVGAGVVLAGTYPSGKIYRSTDYGASWTYQATLGAETSVNCLVGLGNGIVLAGTGANAKIYKSTDAGLSWSLVYTATGEQFIYTLNTLGSGVVLAGGGGPADPANVYRSIDYGAAWGLIQALGSENSIRFFITLGNGSTLAGTGDHAQIFNSLNCSADLEMIHNLGFLPSAAAEPSAYFLLAQPKFDPFPMHLKYQSSDYIRINLVQGGIYDFFCAQVTEILDLKQKRLPYRMEITQTPWLSGTVAGPLPSTIERVASYTPLVTANFDDILTVYDNNLQAAMDRLDDHTHGAQLYDETEKPSPDDDDLFFLVDSLTATHLTRKISWSDFKAAMSYTSAREKLAAARTYYVRTSGDDANDGLIDNAYHAFLTIQHAVDVASALDNGGFDVTIQVADGTYTVNNNIVCKTFLGSGKIIIQGNTYTPANCILAFGGSVLFGFSIDGVLGTYQIQGFKMTMGVVCSSHAFNCINRSNINVQNIEFSTGWDVHMNVETGATINIIGPYKISASCTNIHIENSTGYFICNVAAGITVIVAGTPNIPIFCVTGRVGWTLVYAARCIFSGSTTGKRYAVTENAVVDTIGGGAIYFPGNVAGTTATGGLYS
jgi:photosystem II stability/assembly factor-like uncharacterized protein